MCWDFRFLGRVIRMSVRFMDIDYIHRASFRRCPSEGGRLFDAKLRQCLVDLLGWSVNGKCLITAFMGFRDFWVEGEGEFFGLEEGFYSLKVCHFFCDNSGSVSCVAELKGAFYKASDFFLQLERVCC
jgi:hypothetical protein